MPHMRWRTLAEKDGSGNGAEMLVRAGHSPCCDVNQNKFPGAVRRALLPGEISISELFAVNTSGRFDSRFRIPGCNRRAHIRGSTGLAVEFQPDESNSPEDEFLYRWWNTRK